MPGGSLTSKPTWSNTSGCSDTSAFLVLGESMIAGRNPHYLRVRGSYTIIVVMQAQIGSQK